jgi:cytidine deaminase
MQLSNIQIPVEIYTDFHALKPEDALLLEAARVATGHAYAPYSKFKVGAAIRLSDGNIITGSNQENASFPAGVCAERVVLSAASAVAPGLPVTAMALTYINKSGAGQYPISPCGICRQTLAEYEQRFNQPIRLILGGNSGEIFILNKATDLLPLAFSSQELNAF